MLEKPKSSENADSRTKVCSACKQEKLRSEFYARRDRPNGLQACCKKCTNGGRWKHGRFKDEVHKKRTYEINKASYQRNKDKYALQTGRRNAKYKVAALEAYGTLVCSICGFDAHPAALEFHHRDPGTKLFNVSTAICCPEKYPWDVILDEIAKCDVICSNCHRTQHCSRSYEGIWEVQHATDRDEDYYGQKGKHKRKT
jgi:hypothetical protein